MNCSVGGQLLLVPLFLSYSVVATSAASHCSLGRKLWWCAMAACVPVAQMEHTPLLQGIASCMCDEDLVLSHSTGIAHTPHLLIPGRDCSSEMVSHVGRHDQHIST